MRLSMSTASMDFPRRVPPTMARIGLRKRAAPSWQAMNSWTVASLKHCTPPPKPCYLLSFIRLNTPASTTSKVLMGKMACCSSAVAASAASCTRKSCSNLSAAICQTLLETHCHLGRQTQIDMPLKLPGLQQVVQPPSFHAISLERWPITEVEPASPAVARSHNLEMSHFCPSIRNFGVHKTAFLYPNLLGSDAFEVF